MAEFETVQALTRQAAEVLAGAAARTAALVRRLRGEAPRSAGEWVDGLTELRRAQGRLLGVKELRYADTDRVDELAAEVEADIVAFAGRAVTFLAREDAFATHHEDVDRLAENAATITTVAEAGPSPLVSTSRPRAWRRSPRSSQDSTSATPPSVRPSWNGSPRCSAA